MRSNVAWSRRTSVLLLAVVLTGAAFTPSAAARSRHTSSTAMASTASMHRHLLRIGNAGYAMRDRHMALTMHAQFRRLRHAPYVLGSGRYVFAAALTQNSQQLGTLRDEATGETSTVGPPPGCAGPTGPLPTGPELMGGPWLLVDCSDTQINKIELYNLANATWTSVTPAASVQTYCASASMSQCTPVAVGADWIEFDETCYHCGDTYVFQNIRTGEVVHGSNSTNYVNDLNSPSLTKPVCRPLRVPRAGSLVFDGPFAISVGRDSDLLERCGKTWRQRIGPVALPTEDPHAIVWQAEGDSSRSSDQLFGIRLPSLRRFVLDLPAAAGSTTQVLLTGHGLFVVAGDSDRLWMSDGPGI
jgi:hypothetical protein